MPADATRVSEWIPAGPRTPEFREALSRALQIMGAAKMGRRTYSTRNGRLEFAEDRYMGIVVRGDGKAMRDFWEHLRTTWSRGSQVGIVVAHSKLRGRLTIELGPEYDPDLLQAVRSVLVGMGAKRLGGLDSLDFSTVTVRVGRHRVVVTVETYMGVRVSAPAKLALRIRDEVLARWSLPPRAAPTARPEKYGYEFLQWFRAKTEEAWAAHTPRALSEFQRSGVGGRDWVQGTKWSEEGLSEERLAAIETERRLKFPKDHRYFLATLHCTVPDMRSAYFVDDRRMAMREEPGVYNWLDRKQIDAAVERAFDGIMFDVEQNGVWDTAWGTRASTPIERRALVRAAFDQAPRLIPIYGHRYLLSDEAGLGSAVLSIHQTEMIVYGGDLREYVLNDFGSLLGSGEGRPSVASIADLERKCASVPFWGRFLAQSDQFGRTA